LRLNLVLLLSVAFLPFPTRLFAEFIGKNSPERVAAPVYGVSLLLTSLLLQQLWQYAARHQLVRPDIADEEVELLTRRLTPGAGGYVVLIIAGLFIPVIAVAGYLGIALFYLIPFGPFRAGGRTGRRVRRPR
jgi:TMEM175 potassium channel family protein